MKFRLILYKGEYSIVSRENIELRIQTLESMSLYTLFILHN